MLKPNNYENVQSGEYVPPMLGGHHMIIMNVSEQKNRNGGDMLVVHFDFAANDAQPGYFKKQYDADIRPDKKWPYNGTSYINCLDSNNQCSVSFKKFITSFEESNGCQANWTEGKAFTDQFRGKKIGGVYGRVEDDYNGERKMKTQLRWFCSDARADGAKVPSDKMLKDNSAVSTAMPNIPNPVDTVVSDVSLPWNN